MILYNVLPLLLVAFTALVLSLLMTLVFAYQRHNSRPLTKNQRLRQYLYAILAWLGVTLLIIGFAGRPLVWIVLFGIVITALAIAETFLNRRKRKKSEQEQELSQS